jgi:hypothetical protein
MKDVDQLVVLKVNGIDYSAVRRDFGWKMYRGLIPEEELNKHPLEDVLATINYRPILVGSCTWDDVYGLEDHTIYGTITEEVYQNLISDLERRIDYIQAETDIREYSEKPKDIRDLIFCINETDGLLSDLEHHTETILTKVHERILDNQLTIMRFLLKEKLDESCNGCNNKCTNSRGNGKS